MKMEKRSNGSWVYWMLAILAWLSISLTLNDEKEKEILELKDELQFVKWECKNHKNDLTF